MMMPSHDNFYDHVNLLLSIYSGFVSLGAHIKTFCYTHLHLMYNYNWQLFQKQPVDAGIKVHCRLDTASRVNGAI